MDPMQMLQMLGQGAGGGGVGQMIAGAAQNPAIQQVIAQLVQGMGQPAGNAPAAAPPMSAGPAQAREMIPEEVDTANREPHTFGSDEDMLEQVRGMMGGDAKDDVPWEGDMDSGPTMKDLEVLYAAMGENVPGTAHDIARFEDHFGEEAMQEAYDRLERERGHPQAEGSGLEELDEGSAEEVTDIKGRRR